jgi:hypothetical protein
VSRWILEELAPTRKALVLPLNYGSFYPGLPLYEDLVATVRGRPKVDLFGFVYPFGVVPESVLVHSPEILAIGRTMPERAAHVEMAVRTRAWFDTVAVGYRPVVLLNYGDLMPVWSRALRNCPTANRVQIVNVHRRTGLNGTLVKTRIDKALS